VKRIIICCDGTWNRPDENKDGLPVPTNVVKVASAIEPYDDKRVAQMLYYDTGIGTSGSLLQRLYDGATGSGLSRNILEAYEFLIRNYELGDELFLLGFSRGAFTVRSLAGLIRNCGILRVNAIGMLPQAYKLYRSQSPATHPREKEATLFRRSHSVSEIIPIKFIGVWDTVGALGNPLLLNGVLSRRYRFHDTDLSSIISYAYQALAIDEKRRQFEPTLWHQQPQAKNQRLEQVWFAGVHSNVGGGYPSTKLSDIPLAWICEKAKECGLAVGTIQMSPDSKEKPEESWKGLYCFTPRLFRDINKAQKPDQWWKGFYNLIRRPFRRDNKPEEKKGPTLEKLHPSVIEKYQNDPSYRPRNLVNYFERFPEQLPRHP
jgi:uncharacterized protein (DUF2235 family)